MRQVNHHAHSIHLADDLLAETRDAGVAGIRHQFLHGAAELVDERLALDPNLPLGQALRFWERLDNCAAPARAHEILQLEPLLDVPVRYLSTGQKKRAALARLLNRSCPIWLLDEPLNGLDTQAQASFEALIAQHCAAGGIALVASHQGIALPDPARVELAEYAA